MQGWRATTGASLVGLAAVAMMGGCGDRRDTAADGTDTDTATGTATMGDSADGTAGESDGEGACRDPVAPRQLRLLTRHEYDASVRDLFALTGGDGCTDASQCPSEAACQDGACVIETALPTTFELAGQAGWSTVHVAGSFNGWPGTIAGGGFPLQRDAATNTWSGSFPIPPGDHQYKFVIDESSWIPDPTNPQTADDGFGGSNSVLEVDAQLEEVPPLPLSFTAGLPAEVRPEGYAFDNNVAAGLVTAVHAEQYMQAAQAVAEAAVAVAPAWRPCAPAGDGTACAEQIASEVGRRVWRRPLTSDEVEKIAGLVTGEASFDDGLRVALQAMLASPYFLYKFELGEPDGDRFRLTGYEVAAALSYGLWGTTPDDALLDAAAAGELDTAAGVEAQVQRLLADPRARAQVSSFAVQWLGVEKIATIDKNDTLFPDFDTNLRASILEETRRLAAHVVFDGTGRFPELLAADYTFVDATLAGLYGVEAPQAAWSQVPAPAGRMGILGHASVLASNAYPNQTSPVRRGLFVRRALLCQELPPPPPEAGAVPEVDPSASTRERFEQHMEEPACAACHVYIDPVGFGFEHFDPIGAWRSSDAGHEIDASGELRGLEDLAGADSHPFSSLPELAMVLAGSQAAPACFATHYFRYAHGRLEAPEDECALEDLAQRFAAADHDVVSLVVATLTAPEYRYRR
jgi:hypothetical protein